MRPGQRATCNVQRLIVAILVFGAPTTVGAQDGAGRSAFASVARYAKWPTLAAAVGFTAVALSHNRDADRVYQALTDYCVRNAQACNIVAVDGRRRYAEDDPERLYQETLRLDHRARTWLIAGQLSLVASGTMFLLDLITGNDGPENIPYAGFSVVADGRRLGLRVPF